MPRVIIQLSAEYYAALHEAEMSAQILTRLKQLIAVSISYEGHELTPDYVVCRYYPWVESCPDSEDMEIIIWSTTSDNFNPPDTNIERMLDEIGRYVYKDTAFQNRFIVITYEPNGGKIRLIDNRK